MFFSRSSVPSSLSSEDSCSSDSDRLLYSDRALGGECGLNEERGADVGTCLYTPVCVARATCSEASAPFLFSVFSRYASVCTRCSTASSSSFSRSHSSFSNMACTMAGSTAFTKRTRA